jgi:rubrerythrin
MEKALAIAAYGESVAAYRYRTLTERAVKPEQRRIFEEMADEEQGHHQAIRQWLDREFPDSDFVLTDADKALVIVGPRMIDLSGPKAFREAINMIYESERLTGSFYAALHDLTHRSDLKPMLKEMAEECFEHAERLKSPDVIE